MIYYVQGSQSIPLPILLPIAGQILNRGIISVCEVILEILAYIAQKRPVPLDTMTAFLIEIDARIGGSLTPSNILLNSIVTLLFMNTPEVLIGTLGSGVIDIREKNPTTQNVVLASIGGGHDINNYFTSGQILLSSKDPDTVYAQIAYRPDGLLEQWILPRKPTVWFEQWLQSKPVEKEKTILVSENQAVALIPVSDGVRCNSFKVSNIYGFRLQIHNCTQSVFGFSIKGPNLEETSGYFQLNVGEATVRYYSQGGKRKVSGGKLRKGKKVDLPRVEQLRDEMGQCFLNAASFNRPVSKMGVLDRMAISALVRSAWVTDPSGFSEPEKRALALVKEVSVSNLSRWVVLTVFISTIIIILATVWFRWRLRVLSRELGQWMALGEGVQEVLSCSPRYAASNYTTWRKGRFDNILVRIEVENEAHNVSLTLTE